MGYEKSKKVKEKTETRKKEYTPITFINYRLNDDQSDDVKIWLANNPPPSEKLIDELVCAGYKMSITADNENACFVVSCTGTDDTPNAHLCMSSRSSELHEAVAIAHYKIATIFEWGFWDVKTRANNWG